ncbi:Tlg2-vesicle protein, partial [Pichia californica]
MERATNVVYTGTGNFKAWFSNLTTRMKVGVILALVTQFAISIFILINNHAIIEYIVGTSDRIRDMGFKGVLLFMILLSIVSFPPFIGFAMICIIIGIVYGFSGFPLIAITSSVMSTVSLCCFKYFFTETSQRIIDSHEKLQIFVSVIKDSDTTFFQEVIILTLMKLCPLPYSITNGGLGCVPNLSPLAFFIACCVCSPKYLIQIFIGIQLRKIGGIDKDNTKRTGDILILFVTGTSFGILSMTLYKRLQKKIEQRSGQGVGYVPLDTIDNNNMRVEHPISLDSSHSSVFDRYSEELLNNSRFSVLSEESLTGFDKSIKNFDSIQSISPATLDSLTTYSHYEPVNNILQFLQTKKLTLQNLKQNNKYDPSLMNTKTTSYCQYWEIDDEKYQIINMLEPELIRTQMDLFQFYQFIRKTNFDLKIISMHYIPEIINFKSNKQIYTLNEIEKNSLFKSFQILSNLFNSLSLNLNHVMENKIVVNSRIVYTIIIEEFEKIDKLSDTFISGITILSELYDSNEVLKEYLISNGKIILSQNGLNIKDNNDYILPHLLINEYNFKFNLFESLLPFELVNFQMTKVIDQCDDNPEEISGDNNQSISNRHESVGSDIYNSESESVVINTNENYVEDYTNGVNIIPTTPTSAVSTTLSFVNAVGNIETTPNTETLDNTPPIKEIGHVQKKLQQIYENDPNIKENENTERLISKSEEDEIIVNDSDIVHQEIWDNNETTVSTAGSETSATIDEIIILETLQRNTSRTDYLTKPSNTLELDSLPDFMKSPTPQVKFHSAFPPLTTKVRVRGVMERAGFDVYKPEKDKNFQSTGKSPTINDLSNDKYNLAQFHPPNRLHGNNRTANKTSRSLSHDNIRNQTVSSLPTSKSDLQDNSEFKYQNPAIKSRNFTAQPTSNSTPDLLASFDAHNSNNYSPSRLSQSPSSLSKKKNSILSYARQRLNIHSSKKTNDETNLNENNMDSRLPELSNNDNIPLAQEQLESSQPVSGLDIHYPDDYSNINPYGENEDIVYERQVPSVGGPRPFIDTDTAPQSDDVSLNFQPVEQQQQSYPDENFQQALIPDIQIDSNSVIDNNSTTNIPNSNQLNLPETNNILQSPVVSARSSRSSSSIESFDEKFMLQQNETDNSVLQNLSQDTLGGLNGLKNTINTTEVNQSNIPIIPKVRSPYNDAKRISTLSTNDTKIYNLQSLDENNITNSEEPVDYVEEVNEMSIIQEGESEEYNKSIQQNEFSQRIIPNVAIEDEEGIVQHINYDGSIQAQQEETTQIPTIYTDNESYVDDRGDGYFEDANEGYNNDHKDVENDDIAIAIENDNDDDTNNNNNNNNNN